MVCNYDAKTRGNEMNATLCKACNEVESAENPFGLCVTCLSDFSARVSSFIPASEETIEPETTETESGTDLAGVLDCINGTPSDDPHPWECRKAYNLDSCIVSEWWKPLSGLSYRYRLQLQTLTSALPENAGTGGARVEDSPKGFYLPKAKKPKATARQRIKPKTLKLGRI